MAKSFLESQMKGVTKQTRNFVRQLHRGARVSISGQPIIKGAATQLARDFATEAARNAS